MFIHCSNVNVPKIWMAWFWLRAVTYFEPLQYVTTLLQALQPFPWPNLIPSFGPAFFVSHLPRSQYTTAIDPPLLKPSWWSRRHQHWLSCLSRDLLEHFWSAVMLLAMAQTLVRQPWEQRLCGKSLFKKKKLVLEQVRGMFRVLQFCFVSDQSYQFHIGQRWAKHLLVNLIGYHDYKRFL